MDYKESRAPKNWCFWTVVLEKTLENPLDCKEIQPVHPKWNQSWIFTEGLMLKQKLQYFHHVIWRTDLLEKTLMLGKIKDRRRRGWQRMKWLDGITESKDMSLRTNSRRWWRTGKPGVQQSIGSQRVGHDRVTEQELAQRQTYRPMEQTKKSRNKLTHLWSINIWQKRQEYTMEKRHSLQ